MSLTGKALGRTGEKAACRFLKSRGYTILETNFRTRAFEIDIIARKEETLCFVEVKTRASAKKGLPREAVVPGKQKKIIMGASYYLKAQKITNQRVRFDVVEVFYTDSDSPPRINLIRNAFFGS